MVLKGCLGRAVLHQFDREEEAQAAHVADRWMLLFQSIEFWPDIGLQLGGAFDELQPLHLFDGCRRRTERNGMRLVSVAVREVAVLEVIGQFLGRRAEAKRHVGAR